VISKTITISSKKIKAKRSKRIRIKRADKKTKRKQKHKETVIANFVYKISACIDINIENKVLQIRS
jgi:hypothetical protein